MIHLALVLALGNAPVDADEVDATRESALRNEQFAFCTDPALPLGMRQKRTCAVARELDDCKGLVTACDADKPPSMDWLAKLAQLLAPIAHVLLYFMVAAIVIAVAIPVISALRQLKRRKKKADVDRNAPNVAQLVAEVNAPPPDETDPETALLRAEELLAKGDPKRALGFSLAAALGALDRRGAIRIAKHRTNGEYVRACTEAGARTRLREIVRTFDAVEFGGAEATPEKALRATSRAKEIVRAAAIVTTLGLVLFGCSPPKKGADPAGNELPSAILERNGFVIEPLGSALSTMPIPERSADSNSFDEPPLPTVIIDMEEVPLDDETQAHLLRWVEAGGALVLFGKVEAWPRELGAKLDFPTTRELHVTAGVRKNEAFDAKVGRREAFAWKDGPDGPVQNRVIAELGTKTYASVRPFGNGTILGVATDDLWTNVGVMPKHNAAALVTLVRAAAHGKELRIAHAEDGIPPPSNPFAALIAAGLGKGMWHALAASILLFLCYGIRHARPRSAPGEPRRAFVEHVEATGAFYARARARTYALVSYGRFVELRLREIAPRGTDPANYIATRTGADVAHVTKLLDRARDAQKDEIPRGDELEVIGELRTLLAKALGARPRNAP